MRRLMNMKQSMDLKRSLTLKRSRNLKRLAVTMLALLLAMGTGAAMADKGRHGGGHGGPDKHHGGHDRHHGYNKHHGGYGQAYRHGYKDGYRNGHWRAGRWSGRVIACSWRTMARKPLRCSGAKPVPSTWSYWT